MVVGEQGRLFEGKRCAPLCGEQAHSRDGLRRLASPFLKENDLGCPGGAPRLVYLLSPGCPNLRAEALRYALAESRHLLAAPGCYQVTEASGRTAQTSRL